MSDVIGGSIPAPSGLDCGLTLGNIGLPVPPSVLDLVGAVSDTVPGIILTFNRPPKGQVLDPSTYAITGDGAIVPPITGVAWHGGGQYPVQVRLAIGHQLQNGGAYAVSFSGLLGACDEAAGVTQTAFVGTASAPRFLEAIVYGTTIQCGFDLVLNPDTVGNPDDWSLSGDVELPSILSAAALPGSRGFLLTCDGEVLDGTVVRCPDFVSDPAWNAVDPDWMEAPVTLGLAAPVLEAEDGEQTFLWATLNGTAIARPWSPLPDDPTDEDECLARFIIAVLGTDRRAKADDETPSAYRGGSWSDTYCPERASSRLWMLVNAPSGDDTLARASQYLPEDLAPLVAQGLLSAVTCDAWYENDDETLSIALGYLTPDGRAQLLRMGVR